MLYQQLRQALEKKDEQAVHNLFNEHPELSLKQVTATGMDALGWLARQTYLDSVQIRWLFQLTDAHHNRLYHFPNQAFKMFNQGKELLEAANIDPHSIIPHDHGNELNHAQQQSQANIRPQPVPQQDGQNQHQAQHGMQQILEQHLALMNQLANFPGINLQLDHGPNNELAINDIPPLQALANQQNPAQQPNNEQDPELQRFQNENQNTHRPEMTQSALMSLLNLTRQYPEYAEKPTDFQHINAAILTNINQQNRHLEHNFQLNTNILDQALTYLHDRANETRVFHTQQNQQLNYTLGTIFALIWAAVHANPSEEDDSTPAEAVDRRIRLLAGTLIYLQQTYGLQAEPPHGLCLGGIVNETLLSLYGEHPAVIFYLGDDMLLTQANRSISYKLRDYLIQRHSNQEGQLDWRQIRYEALLIEANDDELNASQLQSRDALIAEASQVIVTALQNEFGPLFSDESKREQLMANASPSILTYHGLPFQGKNELEAWQFWIQRQLSHSEYHQIEQALLMETLSDDALHESYEYTLQRLKQQMFDVLMQKQSLAGLTKAHMPLSPYDLLFDKWQQHYLPHTLLAHIKLSTQREIFETLCQNLATSVLFFSGDHAPVELNNAIFEKLKQKNQLAGTNLQHCDLGKDADLADLNLQQTTLTAQNLDNANLVGTKLNQAHLAQASMRYADLRGADLRDADLQQADLTGANLQGALINAARLQNAELQNTRWDNMELFYLLDKLDIQNFKHLARQNHPDLLLYQPKHKPSLLQLACYKQCTEIVRYLVSNDAQQVIFKDSLQRLSIHWAAYFADYESLSIILDATINMLNQQKLNHDELWPSLSHHNLVSNPNSPISDQYSPMHTVLDRYFKSKTNDQQQKALNCLTLFLNLSDNRTYTTSYTNQTNLQAPYRIQPFINDQFIQNARANIHSLPAMLQTLNQSFQHKATLNPVCSHKRQMVPPWHIAAAYGDAALIDTFLWYTNQTKLNQEPSLRYLLEEALAYANKDTATKILSHPSQFIGTHHLYHILTKTSPELQQKAFKALIQRQTMHLSNDNANFQTFINTDIGPYELHGLFLLTLSNQLNFNFNFPNVAVIKYFLQFIVNNHLMTDHQKQSALIDGYKLTALHARFNILASLFRKYCYNSQLQAICHDLLNKANELEATTFQNILQSLDSSIIETIDIEQYIDNESLINYLLPYLPNTNIINQQLTRIAQKARDQGHTRRLLTLYQHGWTHLNSNELAELLEPEHIIKTDLQHFRNLYQQDPRLFSSTFLNQLVDVCVTHPDEYYALDAIWLLRNDDRVDWLQPHREHNTTHNLLIKSLKVLPSADQSNWFQSPSEQITTSLLQILSHQGQYQSINLDSLYQQLAKLTHGRVQHSQSPALDVNQYQKRRYIKKFDKTQLNTLHRIVIDLMDEAYSRNDLSSVGILFRQDTNHPSLLHQLIDLISFYQGSDKYISEIIYHPAILYCAQNNQEAASSVSLLPHRLLQCHKIDLYNDFINELSKDQNHSPCSLTESALNTDAQDNNLLHYIITYGSLRNTQQTIALALPILSDLMNHANQDGESPIALVNRLNREQGQNSIDIPLIANYLQQHYQHITLNHSQHKRPANSNQTHQPNKRQKTQATSEPSSSVNITGNPSCHNSNTNTFVANNRTSLFYNDISANDSRPTSQQNTSYQDFPKDPKPGNNNG